MRQTTNAAGVFCLSMYLVDFTAGTILDKFQNETAAQAVERVLKKLAGEKAEEILAVCCSTIRIEHLLKLSKQTRESRLPSFTFISAYFAAFRSRQCKIFSCPVQFSYIIPAQDLLRFCRNLHPPAITLSSSPWKRSRPPTTPTH